MDNTVYATLERGSAEWIARILEPGKLPAYFAPPDGRAPMEHRSLLCAAVNRAYGGPEHVTFLATEHFNRMVKEAEGRMLVIPDEYPPLTFQIGQEVYNHPERIPRTITGIRLDEHDEPGLPQTLVWMYCIGYNWWYNADELSLEPPAQQVVTIGVLMAEDDDLFLFEANDLP